MKKLGLNNRYILSVLIITYATIALIAAFVAYTKYDDLPTFKPNPIKEWAISQINADLKGKEIKPSYPEFDAYIKKHKLPIGKIIIKKGEVFSEIEVAKNSSDRTNKMTPHNAWKVIFYLNKINNLIKKGAKISDVTFYLLALDAPHKTITTIFKTIKESPPIFVFATNKHDKFRHKFILTPDDYTIANDKLDYWAGWHSISKRVISASENSAWQNKVNKLLWRGRLYPDEFAPSSKSRRWLKKISLAHPNLMNVEYAQPNKYHSPSLSAIYKMLALEFSLDNFLTKEEQIKYKILLNLDGHTCTYPGLLWRLLSNSITLKQDSDNVQWFYSALKPWVHYIPVRNDLSDLVEKVNWVKNNDAEAKKIANNSTKFIKENLMIEDIDLYIVTLLNKYAELQQKA